VPPLDCRIVLLDAAAIVGSKNAIINRRNFMAVGLAIIGTGIAARKHHWPALQQLRRKFRIVCVCNRTEPTCRAFAEMAGVKEYTTDWREVLARPAVEAVDLVLPVELNFEVPRAALAMGKHVLCEKPLAISRREAREMVRLATASDR